MDRPINGQAPRSSLRARACQPLACVLLTAVALLATSSAAGASSKSTAHAVRSWGHAHQKAVTALGNAVYAFSGTLTAGEPQCGVLVGALGNVSRLPKVPSAAIRTTWKESLVDLSGGASICSVMTTVTERNEAIADLENGAAAFKSAVRAMGKDGVSFHFRKPAASATTTTTKPRPPVTTTT
jgi:hypothetical protein